MTGERVVGVGEHFGSPANRLGYYPRPHRDSELKSDEPLSMGYGSSHARQYRGLNCVQKALTRCRSGTECRGARDNATSDVVLVSATTASLFFEGDRRREGATGVF